VPDKIRVMVVEDDEAFRRILCENLEECGFEVTFAKDGLEAVTVIGETVMPQVVITDIIMPRKEGLEVITDIRRKHPDIRLIAISGGGRSKSVDFLQMAKQLGADATLQKPLDIDELEKTIRRLVS
jgi:CheY-like chemotaxis protein